jgi:hypothetical protein
MEKKIKIKKISLITLLITALYFLQCYWAMGAYFNDLSCGCLDCSVWIELIFDSVVQLIIIIPIRLLCWKLEIKKLWQIICPSIILCCFWLFMDNEIFKDRVSCWSTFSTSEEWYYTRHLSLLPIFVCIIVFAFLLYPILNLNKK